MEPTETPVHLNQQTLVKDGWHYRVKPAVLDVLQNPDPVIIATMVAHMRRACESRSGASLSPTTASSTDTSALKSATEGWVEKVNPSLNLWAEIAPKRSEN